MTRGVFATHAPVAFGIPRRPEPSNRAEPIVNAFLDIDGGALDTFCRRHHIVRLALFGSRARGEARPDSDVDLLVEFEVGRAPGLIGISAMELELSELIGGLTVDLRTREDLSRHFRYRVSASALVQYAR